MTAPRRRPPTARRWAGLVAAGLAAAAILVPGTPALASARSEQWYLSALRVPSAQRIGTGAGVTVALLDTGVDGSHADLAGRIVGGTSLGAARGTPAQWDDDGHGTALAGVIAGNGGAAGTGVLGVAPGAVVLPVRLAAHPTTTDVAAGIRWAAGHGADVVVVPFGSPGTPAEAQRQAVRYALRHDVVVVAAAGDRGDGNIVSPAGIAGVVAVTGTGRDGYLWPGTARGHAAVLAAPAARIVGPAPADRYPSGRVTLDGTGCAAAIVAGVAALVRARYRGMDAANVVNRLVATARDAGPVGHDTGYGYGVVDPVAALTASVPSATANPLGEPGPAGSSPVGTALPGTYAVGQGPGPGYLLVAAVLVALAAGGSAVWWIRRRTRAVPAARR